MMDKKNFSLFSGKGKNKDLRVRWFIYWYEYDLLTAEKKRKKRYIYSYPTVAEREAAALDLVAELTRQNGWTGKCSVLMDHLKQVLEERLPYLGKSSHTTYKGFLRNYEQFMRVKNTHEVQSFVKYLSERPLSPTTINHHIALLRTLYNPLVKRKLITENPCEDIRKLKERRKHGKFFTREQQVILKKEIRNRYPELMMPLKYMYYCFIRPRKEMRLLQVKDLNLEAGFIRVPANIAKDAEDRLVVLPEVFLRELRQLIQGFPPDYYLVGRWGYPSDKPVESSSFYKKFRRVLKALNFEPGYTLYSWKNTGNYNAIRNNIPLKELQLQNGHSDLRTTQIYTKTMTPFHSEFIRSAFPEF